MARLTDEQADRFMSACRRVAGEGLVFLRVDGQWRSLAASAEDIGRPVDVALGPRGWAAVLGASVVSIDTMAEKSARRGLPVGAQATSALWLCDGSLVVTSAVREDPLLGGAMLLLQYPGWQIRTVRTDHAWGSGPMQWEPDFGGASVTPELRANGGRVVGWVFGFGSGFFVGRTGAQMSMRSCLP